ncbi:hypothetical protein RHGRI_016127 [Rhododendron griersonianum]|uniref:Uncharacterized protein n=1 Tax=Rhododendron griersonianum TaxID=479676 RepID=A0AAV6JSE1_9ERIC|nr:hypothetical protein RHGRI_016127 [Rhododendron griersonianum]
MIDGFLPSNTCWIFHGEFVTSPVARTEDKGQSDSYEGDEIHELLYDAFGIPPFVPPTDDTIDVLILHLNMGIMSKRISQTRCSAFESSSSETEQSGSESSSSLDIVLITYLIHQQHGTPLEVFLLRDPIIARLQLETKRNNGVPVSRLQVWKAAYLKEGSLASDAVNEVMTQMEGSSTESTCIDEGISVKVMGPEQPGRVRTFGLGPSIKDVFGGGYWRSQEQTHIFQAQMQEQFQLYRVQFETQMKEMMETQMAAMRTQMDATIQSQAATIQAQQTRIEYLESQLVTRGGLAAREAAWGHHPMSQPQQNSHEFTSSSSHQKVAQSKTKNKSKSKRRPHI